MALVLDGSAGVSGVDGTASNPSYEGTDSNTGIFFPAADTVAIGTGGTEALRVNSAQNVGVGTTSPTAASSRRGLVLRGNANGAELIVQSTSATDGTSDGFSLTTVGTDAYLFNRLNGFTAFATNNAERARITGNGEFLVGTTTSSAKFVVNGSSGGGGTSRFIHPGNADFGVVLTLETSGGTDSPALSFKNYNSNSPVYYSISTNSAGALLFNSGGSSGGFGTERARIDSTGSLFIAKTAAGADTYGGYFSASPGGFFHFVVTNTTSTSSESPIYVNRQTSDGNLIEFRQANTAEGIISVSGTTVTYGGGHLARFAQLPDGLKDEILLKGTVLTNLDEMCVWINKETGQPADNEQCNKVKVSEVEGDASVAGVFVSWTYDEQCDTNDLFVAMTGDMIIRIAQGVTVQKGDLLMSAGDGTAKPQGDDIVRSKTVAKVTSNHVTCIYDDGSYCVPCVLMAC